MATSEDKLHETGEDSFYKLNCLIEGGANDRKETDVMSNSDFFIYCSTGEKMSQKSQRGRTETFRTSRRVRTDGPLTSGVRGQG